MMTQPVEHTKEATWPHSTRQKFEQAMHVAPGHSQARHPIGLCMSGLSALMYALHSHAHLT
jgi:hypothetical protein